MEKPKTPLVQLVYGQIVYWLCIIATFICIVGPAMSIVFPKNNLLEPRSLFITLWKGSTPQTIWQELTGGFPGGHFWLKYLNTWDGIIQLGIVIGCVSAGLGLLIATVLFLIEKPPSYLWALLSMFIVLMVLMASLGIYHV